MPQDLAQVIVDVLKIVNLIMSTWVDLGAPDPLTSMGSILVDNVAQTAVAMAYTAAQLVVNNPIP